MEVHIVFYTQDGVVKHARVFEDKEKVRQSFARVKELTVEREDEDSDMISCEVE